jgi:hypothetical protein
VRRAVREFGKDADADDDGCNVVRRVDAARNPSVPAQILSKQGKSILGSLVIPMT